MLISLKNIKKIYKNGDVKTPALMGINLDIKKGEFVSITGASGSGKSTLMHIIGFLDRPTSGEYYFKGKEASKYSDNELAKVRNEEIGFIFQTFNLLQKLTVLENVEIPLIYAGIERKKRIKAVERVIDIVGLSHRINHKASQLSGGQRQRVAIARALVNNPSVILADEPTGNLDSVSGGSVLKFMQNLNDMGNTIVIVTHESYVAYSAKRIVNISDGIIISDKNIEEKDRHLISSEGFAK